MKTFQILKKLKKEQGAAVVEYALVVALISIASLGAIETFAKGGILGSFCKVMHQEMDLEKLKAEGKWNPDTGSCNSGVSGAEDWEFNGWGQ